MTQKTNYQMNHHELMETYGLSEKDYETNGLSSSEVKKRQGKYGENTLKEGKKKPPFMIFLEQFKDLLVIILIIAAIISMASGSVESTIVIFVVLILNAILGTVQYIKAEKSLDSLKVLSSPHAKVLRDGVKQEILSKEIVPGDLLLLEAGDMIAADGRILKNYSLQVNESSLTGESTNVDKQEGIVIEKIDSKEEESSSKTINLKDKHLNEVEELKGNSKKGLKENSVEAEIPLADRLNMVYSGTLVTYGRATVIVTETGMHTEMGKIACLMNETKEKRTPLQISLDDFSQKLAVGIVIISMIVLGLRLYQGEPLLDALMFAVALAVAAIPEALSSIVTIVQAMGTQKMAADNAIIKELKAVESLGCVSVICSDKTGTLTQNRMTVENVYVGGRSIAVSELSSENLVEKLILAGILCNDSSITEDGTGIGDPTETALIALARKAMVNEDDIRAEFPRLDEIPFDSDRKLMTTKHKLNGQMTLLTKGALDVLLDRSEYIELDDGVARMTDDYKNAILKKNQQYSENGLRVLAFAYKSEGLENEHSETEKIKKVDHTEHENVIDLSGEEDCQKKLTYEDEYGYTFLGLVAMMDPPREESYHAVKEALGAGIKPIMITGDHKVTATAIAKQIGIFAEGDLALTGQELDAMSDEELDRKLAHISVYARVSPENKIRIVKRWQEKGNIVAMTGDGVNDAPALKRADIGVAMGITGTEVSKDAAAMILSDDNFATIIKAVLNGRNVYRNIKNAIQFLLSGNMAAILAVLYCSFMALPTPFESVHLLFINLLTDSLPALAIGMEPADQTLLKEKPRDPKEGILTKSFCGHLFGYGLLIAIASMSAFYMGLQTNTATASTMAFATLTLARLFHGFNCRSEQALIKIGIMSNKWSIAAFMVGVILLAAVLTVPVLSNLFLVASLSGIQFVSILCLAVMPSVLIQIGKMVCVK